ncbi:hypothetical protein, partial [Stenotrophomonas sp. SG1]|uniref:hypothetical protein n=1 Tax=Stenotrophomonas sp. SG1 TaxID=2944932 RepID=UPI002242E192
RCFAERSGLGDMLAEPSVIDLGSSISQTIVWAQSRKTTNAHTSWICSKFLHRQMLHLRHGYQRR